MADKMPLPANKEFFRGVPKKYKKRKSMYLLCVDCEKNFISWSNQDWISNDGYLGMCNQCWAQYPQEALNNVKKQYGERFK